jgi:hypothetical protein
MKPIFAACAVLVIAASMTGCHRHAAGGPMRACKADIQQFCAGVERTGIRQCMADHADQLSAGCTAAIAARRAAHAQSGAPESAAPASAVAPANK